MSDIYYKTQYRKLDVCSLTRTKPIATRTKPICGLQVDKADNVHYRRTGGVSVTNIKGQIKFVCS